MILNGKTIDLKEDISVEQLLKDYDLNPQKVVVEVNMEILDDEVFIKKRRYSRSYKLCWGWLI